MRGNIRQSFWFHLGIVLALFILLYISFFASLHCFTKHGEELTIPNLTGKDVNSAIAQLKAMKFEIYIDSTYEPDQKPLSILKQVPDTASVVKEGRTVFITVNMLTPPHIPMPSLVNLSYRSAAMLLRNNKLKIGDTTYKPDIAAGAILEQLFKRSPIRPGELIAQGSKIDLVIGDGLGNTEFDVPGVTGSTVDEAMTILNQYNLQPIITPADQLSKITDTSSAYIVDQEPRELNDAGTHNRIKAGDIIFLRIMQNPDPMDIHGNNNTNPPSGVNSNTKNNKTK
jgi:beta-lactam-binding protein with PASTA domain